MKKTKMTVLGIVAGALVGGIYALLSSQKKATNKKNELLERYRSYYTVTSQWLNNKSEGKKLEDYFQKNNIRTIAIYGMGTLGELFYKDVIKTNVKVLYYIDKNVDNLYYQMEEISVIGLDDIENEEEVDAIIVTPVFDFEKIYEELNTLCVSSRIISLEEIICQSI